MRKMSCSGWFFMYFLLAVGAWAAPVPESGLTKCYNDSTEITCPSSDDPFYGQDANYTINPMSYTKLDVNGNILPDSASSWSMVKDNVTGLVWEMKTDKDGIKNYNNPHDADNRYTWFDSNPATNGGDPGEPGDGKNTEEFVKVLNKAKYGGFTDWRMPTVKELVGIGNYGVSFPGPTIDAGYFPNTIPSFYWSATIDSYDKEKAWSLNFNYGDAPNLIKKNANYVRAVRGAQSESLNDPVAGTSHVVDANNGNEAAAAIRTYFDNGSGTVTDPATGLMWEQDGAAGKTWKQALEYCEGLGLAGFTDWRLPTVKELLSLVAYNRYDPAVNITNFPNIFSDYYWSSTTYPWSANSSWGVNFLDGYNLFKAKNVNGYVRAVRGGQLGTLTVTPTSRNVSQSAGSTTFSVSKTGEGTMTWTAAVTSGNGWLSITAGTSGTNDGIITCAFTANTGSSSRTGVIRVTAAGVAGTPKDVSVIQDPSTTVKAVQFWGAWPDGVWTWDKGSNKWTKIPSTSNALMIASGKVDSDTIDDLIGVWTSGLFVRQSVNNQWVKLSGSLPTWITAGDMNANGRDDVVGTWTGDGVYWRNSETGKWTKITSPARQLAAGNIGGSRDDLAGVWNDGLWVRYSANAAWQKIDTMIPVWMTVGDLSGDKRADIVGSYASGTWYRNSASQTWSKITTSAEQLITGDIDGDGRDDLIGIWSNAVWVRYAVSNQWQKISDSKPKWMATGRMVE